MQDVFVKKTLFKLWSRFDMEIWNMRIYIFYIFFVKIYENILLGIFHTY